MSNYFECSDGATIPIGTMYCIGRNYALHAREMGVAVPTDPVVFLKPPAAYVPHGGIITRPSFSHLMHHEVELVVVIGADCTETSVDRAHEVVAGYAVGVDVTLRDIQKRAKERGEPWAVAKGFAGSAPISMVNPATHYHTAFPTFELSLEVNGDVRQRGSTADMERPVAELIRYLASTFTLRKGDCIFTGTPEGVGPLENGDKVVARLDDDPCLEFSIA